MTTQPLFDGWFEDESQGKKGDKGPVWNGIPLNKRPVQKPTPETDKREVPGSSPGSPTKAAKQEKSKVLDLGFFALTPLLTIVEYTHLPFPHRGCNQ